MKSGDSLNPEQQRALLAQLLKNRSDNSRIVPASFAQRRLWFLDRLAPGNAYYNLPIVLQLKGVLDVELIERCFNDLLERHEALRTSFAAQQNEPVQVIHPPSVMSIPLEDLTHLNPTEIEQESRRRAELEIRKPFDLTTGPLFRIKLQRLAQDEHLLLIVIHHIVTDGWSNRILIRELSALHQAYTLGRRPSLEALPIQYADFAVWQQEWFSGDELNIQLAYWKKRLHDLPTMQLPVDKPRPAVQTFDGALVRHELPGALSEDLRSLSKQLGISLFMTLLAAFTVLLQRYSGQDDIVVGSPIANRKRTQLEGLVGFFVNSLVMRTDVSGNPNFRELASRVRETALGAYEHQDMPFEKLVEELHPERDRSRNPLFQVIFALQNAPSAQMELPGLKIQAVDPLVQTARVDLEVYAWEGPDSLSLGFIYSTELFDAATIERLTRHYANLLAAVVAEPERPIGLLPMLDDAEYRQIVEGWNQTRSDYPRDQTVHALFEQQVVAAPDRIAVEYEGESLSYGELNQRANQLAHYLQARGVGPEVMVGICVERSLEMVTGLLAILKSGGAYLPLDPDYPQSRLDFMLADAGVPVLLTHSSLQPQFASFAGDTVCVDSEWPTIARESTDNPISGSDAKSLMYAIYTSGSTGRPKGTLIEHRSAVRLVRETNYIELGADEVFLQFAPISFDASTLELWGSLLNGSRLVVFPAGRSALEELGQVIRDRGVTTLWLTSALFSQMVENHLASLSGVRQLLAGGEALSLPHVKKMLESLGEGRLINGYGPTENTTFTCCHVMTRDSQLGQSVPIGRPISNTTVYILDGQMNPVPVGVAGELYIGGDGLARGYLNQPELTAEKFVADPFSAEADARLYRTGDLVCYRGDGVIEFIGRIDHQVKVRGYRIELGEIETVLVQQAAVSDAVVLVREDEAGDKRLVAYVVPTPAWQAQYPPDEAMSDGPLEGAWHTELVPELRQQLREQLPSYMLPSMFVVLDEFPLNANGKLDRQALPDPEDLQSGLEAQYVAPRTEMEAQLARIWAEVLRQEQVGVHDNFFDLGGHSLMATQVVSRIRGQLNVELPLAEIFAYPTLAELAPAVEALNAGESGDEIIPRASRDAQLPLSFAQERLWFLDQLQPGNPAYIISLALRLKGKLQVDALLASLNAIVDRHEALRTRFADGADGPVQIIDDSAYFELSRLDLSALADEDREPEIRSYLLAEKRRPFDLPTDCLIRGNLLRLGNEDHVLILTMHHIISDGWSLGVLFRELGECYAAFSQGQKPKLAELPVQYADFAVWQRQWLSDEQLDRQLDYWRGQLEDLQVLDLPTDRTRPAMQTYDGAHELLSLDKRLTAQLGQLSKDSGVTLFMTLLAAFMVMLQRYSHQDDIVIGTPIANRNRSEMEGLIAFFVNMLVMRVDCSGNPYFNHLVKRVSDMALGAYEHQDIPFERLVDVLQVDRDLSRNPLFQVFFSLQNAPLEPLQLEGLTLEPVIGETQVTRFDLECHISDKGGALQIGFVYNSNLFDASTIKRMQQHFSNLLAAVVAEPDKPINLLPMLHATEMRLLTQWNQTDRDYPQDVILPHMFEAQVERSPDAIAIEFEEQSLTYLELDRRANTLACRLQEEGIGPEQLVGIHMLRSLEMVISILAILKAGGAYVPLDPENPQDRIAYMAAETRLKVLLTQQHLRQNLPEIDATILSIDNKELDADVYPGRLRSGTATADNLAYVIYTSGSTGNPKGVMNCHRGIVNRLQWMQHDFPLGAEDRVLQKTPFSFDVSIWEFFWPLITGARLVIASPDGHKDPLYLANVIRDKEISNLHFVPSMLKVFLDNIDDADFSRVKRVFCSGEGLPYELQQQFFEAHSAELHNLYGPTEAAIEVSHWACRPDDVRRKVPIGRPTPNSQLHILDRQMQPVPIGVSGELHIGGIQVARGYLRQPELTAEKFIPDPFSDRPGARLYKTGDLTRYLPDGEIEYLGRNDHQIKLRGFRVELGEIESVLCQHVMVKEAVVLCRDDDAKGKRLIAYLVADDPDALSEADLRAFTRKRLPDYMLPSVFAFLDSFPLLSNGKLNLRALPEPDSEQHSREAFVEPRSDLERQLAEIWRKVLSVEQVGIHDNFFDLGGHSLMAILVINGIRIEMEEPVDVVDLFTNPTVSEMAEFLMQRGQETDSVVDESDSTATMAAGKQRMQQLLKRRQQSQSGND